MRGCAKIQWLNSSDLLEIVDKEVFNGPFLARIAKEITLIQIIPVWHLGKLLLFYQIGAESKLQPSPPLEEHQSPGGRSIGDLSPENTEQIRLHPCVRPRLDVQALLLLLEVVDLHHHAADLTLNVQVRSHAA